MAVLLLSKCSTTKDGLSKRIFHNTTARYNGFFNAKEAKKEAITTLKTSNKDDYDSLLSIFFYPTEESVNSIRANMERVVEKTEAVIDRHEMKVAKRDKRKLEKPEMNKWIDDNWLLMGQAYFYERNYWKAEEIFLYVKRKYKTPDMMALSNLWLARNYLEKGDISESEEMLEEVGLIKDFPEELRAEYNLVLADYSIKTGDLQNAAAYLENAVLFTKQKKDKARPTFLLAQIYQRLGESTKSIEAYKEVLKLKPSYEMSFYSQINQAMAFKRKSGNSDDIKNKLYKMLKDEKNVEYFDQIYFALAELELEERNFAKGIDLLNTSLEAFSGNTKQKAKTFLKLADINFDEREYEAAQQYYDSTTALILETHPRFKDISNKASSLTELVSHLRIFQREDSLLRLSILSEEDLTKAIELTMSEDARKREEERAKLLEAIDSGEQIGTVGDFWPWNPTLRKTGKINFEDVWGDRPLEDDWRRKNKLSFGTNETEEPEQVEETVKIEEGRTFEEYLADVPKTPEEITISREKRAEARYNAGLIYKEKLDDFENAVEAFEVLVTETENTEFHPVTHYQLYRTYLAKEQGGYSNPFCGTCNSGYWADQTKTRYPESEYTVLIDNPEFQSLKEIREAEEVEAYEAAFDQYRSGNFNEVIQTATLVIANEKDNHLLPKYYLIKAVCIGEMSSLFGGESEAYKNALKATVAAFPKTTEGKTAQRYLGILSGEVNKEETPKDRPSLYVFREGMGHYVVILIPLEGGNTNATQSKIANFNTTFFKSSSLQVKTRVLGKEYQMVYIRDFENETKAMNYYNAFLVNENILGEVNNMNYPTFAISKSNFSALTKDRKPDAYQEFFEENYLK